MGVDKKEKKGRGKTLKRKVEEKGRLASKLYFLIKEKILKRWGVKRLEIWPKNTPCRGRKWSQFITQRMKESQRKAGRRPFTPEQRKEHKKAMKDFWRKHHEMLANSKEEKVEKSQ